MLIYPWPLRFVPTSDSTRSSVRFFNLTSREQRVVSVDSLPTIVFSIYTCALSALFTRSG